MNGSRKPSSFVLNQFKFILNNFVAMQVLIKKNVFFLNLMSKLSNHTIAKQVIKHKILSTENIIKHSRL